MNQLASPRVEGFVLCLPIFPLRIYPCSLLAPLCLRLRLSRTKVWRAPAREYSCRDIDPAEIDSGAGGSRHRERIERGRPSRTEDRRPNETRTFLTLYAVFFVQEF